MRKRTGFGFLCSVIFPQLLIHIMTWLAITFSPAALSQCALDRRKGLAVGKTSVPLANGRLMTASRCSREIILGLLIVRFLCPHSFFSLIRPCKKKILAFLNFEFTIIQFFCVLPCSRIIEDGDKKLFIFHLCTS